MTPKTIAGGIAGTCIAAAAFVVAGFVAIPFYFTDFSSEEFDPGPLLQADGWETIAGFVDVIDDPTIKGAYAIRLQGTEPASALQRYIEVDPEAPVVFYDVFIRPASGSSIQNSARITVGSATAAFVKAEESDLARLIARDFSSGTGWLDTGVRIPVDFTGQSLDFHRLTIRMDLTKGIADILLDGVLAAYDIGLHSILTSQQGIPFRTFGAGIGDTYIDDFFSGENNPIFDDPLGIGIPADWLTAKGIDPEAANRQSLLDNGQTIIEAFFEDEFLRLGETRELPEDFLPKSVSTSGRLVVFTPLEGKIRRDVDRLQ